jgi:hypothetical protein
MPVFHGTVKSVRYFSGWHPVEGNKLHFFSIHLYWNTRLSVQCWLVPIYQLLWHGNVTETISDCYCMFWFGFFMVGIVENCKIHVSLWILKHQDFKFMIYKFNYSYGYWQKASAISMFNRLYFLTFTWIFKTMLIGNEREEEEDKEMRSYTLVINTYFF